MRHQIIAETFLVPNENLWQFWLDVMATASHSNMSCHRPAFALGYFLVRASAIAPPSPTDYHSFGIMRGSQYGCFVEIDKNNLFVFQRRLLFQVRRPRPKSMDLALLGDGICTRTDNSLCDNCPTLALVFGTTFGTKYELIFGNCLWPALLGK